VGEKRDEVENRIKKKNIEVMAGLKQKNNIHKDTCQPGIFLI